MIDRLEILVSRLRHVVSRNRWSARLLGCDPVIGHADEPGLILIQLDGVGEEVFQRALAEGKMPFLRHLLRDEGYARHPLYSGLASNTPCFQAEFFYGVQGAVPGFGFLDPELDRVAVMSQPLAAAAVERRLQAAGHRGLLEGGSAWSNIFAGGAAESHFCSSTAGLNQLLSALQPFRLIGLILWHGWSVVRVLANLVAESALALSDFVRGQLAGRNLLQELRFVPERVLVSAVLREMVTAGACVDADRGLPVVHLNLLGYDEHAHRRGPDSRFALWTLRGLDRTVKRVWLAAHRSRHRDYQVWVYSDHGQEAVRPYLDLHQEDVGDAIRRVWRELVEGVPAPDISRPDPDRSAESAPPAGESRARGRTIAQELPAWIARRATPGPDPEESGDPLSPPGAEPTVIHRGPIGFIYLAEGTSRVQREQFAERVARQAQVPTVAVPDGEGGARIWSARAGRLRLPGDEAEIFGADHPHAESLTADLLRLVYHEHAGDLVLFSWDRLGPLSFKNENGAHGGPGPRETSAFLVVPPEASARIPEGRTLRPLELRALALGVLDPDRTHLPFEAPSRVHLIRDELEPPREPSRSRLRLMTYNVHGCRGMDGRFSVERIARVIAREKPDVICLQELDQDRTRSGGIDQAQEIAARLEREVHFHAVREVDDGRFGDAVLSSLPLKLVRRGSLPAIETRLDLEQRGVLWVEVDVGGHSVQVMNTHLSIIERERRLQAEALLTDEWLGEAVGRGPLILAGDLNATSRSSTARALSRLLHDTATLDPLRESRAVRPRTWSGRVPLLRIDHFFTSGHFRVLRLDAPRSRLTRIASDHLPLVIDLEWEPSPDASGRTDRKFVERTESNT